MIMNFPRQRKSRVAGIFCSWPSREHASFNRNDASGDTPDGPQSSAQRRIFMLSKEDNELLTQTGPDTPMGNLMRRYWIPALLSEEIPAADCPPVRVRMLGEELVAFRDTQGRIGLIGEHCAHRGTSLFYGRNEECGLRCIYHGWKYDVDGHVLE